MLIVSLLAVVFAALWLGFLEQTAAESSGPTAPPSARSAWVPAIRRSSLLPHPFAGVCMNCHVIMGGAPRRLDPQVVDQWQLSTDERALVDAGQIVRPPSVVSDIKAPLIGRASDLPHSFWGVCSNCHSVVHAGTGPPPGLTIAGLERARQRLVAMDLSDRQIAHANPDLGPDLQQIASYGFGVVALGFLVASLAYPVLLWRARRPLAAPQHLASDRFDRARWFHIHTVSSVGFCGATVAHWALSARGNAILHLSLVLAIAATASGLVQMGKGASTGPVRHRWGQVQTLLTVGMVAAALVGHLVVSSLWL